VEAAQLSQRLDEIEDACEKDSGCQIELNATPFERPRVAGIHVRVEVTVNNQTRVTLNDWRVTDPETSRADRPAPSETTGSSRPPIEEDE
jgi:hypothetical protein